MLVFCVEDDQSIQYVIEKTLKNAGYQSKFFKLGQEFIQAFKNEKPDLILLDIMLPDTSGIDLLRMVRKMNTDIPIIMVSALSSEMDKVVALDLGADDYITKPFGVLELTSRIQAKLRKKQTDVEISIGKVLINDTKHLVQIDGEEIYFTNKEYDILKLLMENQGKVVTKEEVFLKVWQTDFIGETRALDMHIKAIRKKITEKDSELVIKTVRGIGYQIQ